MINIPEGKGECDDQLQFCFHSPRIANQGSASVLIHRIPLCTFLKVLHRFDNKLKANKKKTPINHEIMNIALKAKIHTTKVYPIHLTIV